MLDDERNPDPSRRALLAAAIAALTSGCTAPGQDRDPGATDEPTDGGTTVSGEHVQVRTERPTGRLALEPATVQEQPPYLVVPVAEIENESATPIVVAVSLEWERPDDDGGSGSETARIGDVVPYPPDREDEYLLRSGPAFEEYWGATEATDDRDVSLLFELAAVAEDPLPDGIAVRVGPVRWLTDADF